MRKDKYFIGYIIMLLFQVWVTVALVATVIYGIYELFNITHT